MRGRTAKQKGTRELARRLLEEGFPVTVYGADERFHVGEFSPKLKQIPKEKLLKEAKTVIKESTERGIGIKSFIHPENKNIIVLEFTPTITDVVRKRYGTAEEFEKDAGKYSGHSIEINKQTGIVTLNLGNRGTVALSEKQVQEYLELVKKFNAVKSKEEKAKESRIY